MADKAAKKKRSYALSVFTRNFNTLTALMDESVPLSLVTPQHQKMLESWEKLERVQGEFIEETDIDVEVEADGLIYLVEPDSRRQGAIVRYAMYVKESEKVAVEEKLNVEEDEENKIKEEAREKLLKEEKELKAKLLSLKEEFFLEVGTFKGIANVLVITLREMSNEDLKAEAETLLQEFKRLKSIKMEISRLNAIGDNANIDHAYAGLEDCFLETKKLMLAEAREDVVPHTSGGTRYRQDSTKKEAVKLPSFKGDEKCLPYMSFPIWREQWEVMIQEYEPKWRSGLLWGHLDAAARGRYVGCETDYDESMKRLERYYADPQKVIAVVMKEVSSQPLIGYGEYKNLISYSLILENNFNRLRSLDLDYEMSNTSTMMLILRKFPRSIAEKWNEHLSTLESTIKRKPFKAFIDWLVTQREIWERMAASELGQKKGSLEKSAFGFFGDNSSDRRVCYGCGKEGHIKRMCPDRNRESKEVKDRKPMSRNPRRSPVHKKHWCAFHKGEETRGCWSNSCQELKKVKDVKQRIRLLTENGDCRYCCGDHKSEDCFRKERKCGGGKDNRGCKKDHNLHEMYCPDAQLCFAAQVDAAMGAKCKDDGVVLSVMKVKGKKKGQYESVFWDLGCTSNFVRAAHAESRGFRGKKENLSVTTLGGTVTDYSVTSYNCSIRDEEGELYTFEAYGMDCITGPLRRVNANVLKKLFPHLGEKEITRLDRLPEVDYLIGIKHASWHPERAEKCKEGGDLWIYRGKFGSCIGGRHPEIREMSGKSDALFTVNYVYHAAVIRSPCYSESHELEFCSNRGRKNLQAANCRTALDLQNPSEVAKAAVDVWSPSDVVNPAIGVQDSTVDVVDPAVDVRSSAADVAKAAVDVWSPSEVVNPAIGVQGSAVDVVNPAIGVRSSAVDVVNPAVDVRSSAADVAKADVDVWSPSDVVKAAVDVRSPSDVVNPAVDVRSSGVMNSAVAVQSSAVKVIIPAGDVGVESPACFASKAAVLSEERLFFDSESLGTVVEPRCGGCLCTKCPVPGSKYSFTEQREFDIISSKLFYDEVNRRWCTELPWRYERSVLPRNRNAALKSLIATERSLSRNPEWSKAYCEQIEGMLERGSAVMLTEAEVEKWTGDYHYLPHLAVKQLKKTTPVRLCFDASRKQKGSLSMNECLHKGPDRFMNNLLAVLVGFRNGRVGCAADISKFHNRVFLVEKDIHMQRFLWRDMQVEDEPKTYAVKVNNFGVKPANCIATLALHKSADMFAEKYPQASEDLKSQTYIDDELVAAPSMDEAIMKTKRMDKICEHAGMPNKGWIYSGDKGSSEVVIGGELDEYEERVLGLSWISERDVFKFSVSLGLGGERCSNKKDFEANLPEILTRRMLLSEVSRIFDPMGFLVPVLLEAKLLIRETWCSEKAIGWDDPLPKSQVDRWIVFLKSLFDLEGLTFERSLWPEAETEGLPMLIIFSDGAKLAYGAAAYIRWKLKDGGYWTRLIQSKSKIAPKAIVSIPRMELNGATLGNRIDNFLLKETPLNFSKIFHFVDSSTVLAYVHRDCGRFKPYEGVRIAEIQASNEFQDGRLEGWAWVSGKDNPADWCTKPRTVKEMLETEFWKKGPDFLRLEEEDWPIKFTYKNDKLEGEIVVAAANVVLSLEPEIDVAGRLVKRCSSWKKVIRVIAWVLRFVGRNWYSSVPLGCAELRAAKVSLIKYVQRAMEVDLKEGEKGCGRYRKLSPEKDSEGLWRVGSRLRNFVPFTRDGKLPLIVPPTHRATYLIMRGAHEFCHGGQDSTLARFRSEGFWTVRAGNLSKEVKNGCITCRKLDPKILTQVMGDIPAERLVEPMAWGYCQIDLFGPFSCRGDVNPRTTKKTWALIVEDVNSGAVHLDIMQDYSTEAVLLTLRRFGSLRGWPGIVCSDPGSQLESAAGKLQIWWDDMGPALRTFAGTKNFEWRISPPDSPWRQGKVERRIAVVKRIIKQSLGDTRVTPVELQTVLMEVANICNERPLGLSKPREDGSYTLLTPNHLLMGRSSNIVPDDVGLLDSLPAASRYRIVRHVTSVFWQAWSKEVTPSLVVRQKWHKRTRNLVPGDLVMICEMTKMKGKYRLGVVEEVKMSRDDVVRSAFVKYTIVEREYARGGSLRDGGKVIPMRVKRSVQRLALIMPVEEQSSSLKVEENEHVVKISDNVSCI